MLQFDDRDTSIRNHENDELVDPISSMKVLFICHNREFSTYVVEVLHSYSFEVTCVYQSGAALRLLSASKFDLLLVDCPTNDMDIHRFLEETKNMDVLSIVMSEQFDDAFITNAIMSGAFLVMKKPLTMESGSNLRQYVIRERMLKLEKHRNKNRNLEVESQEIGMQKNVNLGRKRKDRGKSSKQAISYESNLVFDWSDDDDSDYTTEKKKYVEWTTELHAKFMNAVLDQLGEGRLPSSDKGHSRVFPKKILDHMAVPGLTRMQVASHLQKCRRENWKNDLEWFMDPFSVNHKLSRDSTSKRPAGNNFGRMPPILIDLDDQEESSELPVGFNLATNEWHQEEVNHMTNQTERGSVMTRSNQMNIEQRAGYTPSSFQSGYDSKKDEGFDWISAETILDNLQLDAGQGVNHQTFLPNEKQASSDFPYISFSPDEIQGSHDLLDFSIDLDGNDPIDSFIANCIAQDRRYATPYEEMRDKYM